MLSVSLQKLISQVVLAAKINEITIIVVVVVLIVVLIAVIIRSSSSSSSSTEDTSVDAHHAGNAVTAAVHTLLQ